MDGHTPVSVVVTYNDLTEDIAMSSIKPHNALGLAIKAVKVKGHGTVQVKSLNHLREILLSATK